MQNKKANLSLTPTILIVEDSITQAEKLKYMIMDAFPEALVVNALKGQEAIEIAAKEDPDVILLDIIMPGMDGFEVCTRLKADKRLRDIPVVFVTAVEGDKQNRVKALDSGAEAFLSKPIDQSELVAQIRAMLKIRAANIQKRDEKEVLAALVKEKTRELEKSNADALQLLDKIRQEQTLIEAIFDSIPGYLYVYDESGRLIKWNKKHETMTGFTAEELSHMTLDKWFDEEDRVRVNAAVRDVFEKGYGEVEAQLILKSGEKMMTRSSGAPLVVDGKNYFTGIGVDVRERKKLEDQLRQNLKDLLESQRIAHLGTWRLDVATNEVVWSEELYKMYGFDPTIPPPPYTEHMKLFTPESWNKLSTALEHTSKTGSPYELELETVTKDGSNGWMWARGESDKDAEGNIISLWGAAQDITDYKRIEREIKQSEERFQLLFNKAPLGYQSLDLEGCFIDVNQQWLDTLGYSKEEVVGKWFGDFLCPEYIDGFRQRFPIFKSQGYIHSEFEMLSKDGKRLYIAFEGKIGYGADGEFKQTHCILQDITSQRMAEQALIESEERYRCLFENSGVGIGYYTTDGVVISYNKKALETIGGKLDDYVGKSIEVLFPKEQAAIYFSRIEKVVSCDQPQEYEDYFVLNSEPKWFTSTFTRVTNAEGHVIGIQIASLDITERKIAEEELSNSQAILNAAFENSQAGIAIADAPNGKLRFVNNAGLLIRDKSEEELVKNIDINSYVDSWKILHFDGTPYTSEEVPLARAILYGETCSEEFIIKRDDFEDRYVLANAAPIKDSENSIKAGIVVFLDITDRKKTEVKLQQNMDDLLESQRIAHLGTWRHDLATNRVEWSEELYKIFSYDPAFAPPLYTEHAKLFSAESWEKLSTSLEHTRASGIPYELELEIVTRDGLNGWVWARGEVVKDSNGNTIGLWGAAQDITAQKKVESKLLYLSYHDHLTGLFNRRFFEEELIRLDTEQNLPLSVIMCDVNGLKLVNDSFGHDSGDSLLLNTAEIIKKACRKYDTIARIGGDEFIVLLPNTTAHESVKVANQIKELASKEMVANIELSISYGYDTKTTMKQSIIEIIANAENHMYRHKLYERTSLRSKTIDLIMNALFEKSSREAAHSNRVGSICQAVAAKMNLDKDTVNQMKIAGLIHDIGKIGIDEKILNKPGYLTDNERSDIEKHPEIGWRLLSTTDEFSDLARFVLNHHEKWDGSGYPNGFKGETIPLEARIISVADAYDAMTSERSYKKGLSRDEAIKELISCSGTQFDPTVVDVLVKQVILDSSHDTFNSVET